MSGSVFHRCGCRDAVTGRALGSKCSLLSVEGHGSWYLCVDLPGGSDGRRNRVRQGGFATESDAQQALDRFNDPPQSAGGQVGVTVRV